MLYVNSINNNKVQKKSFLHCGHAGWGKKFGLGLSNQERKRQKQSHEHSKWLPENSPKNFQPLSQMTFTPPIFLLL